MIIVLVLIILFVFFQYFKTSDSSGRIIAQTVTFFTSHNKNIKEVDIMIIALIDDNDYERNHISSLIMNKFKDFNIPIKRFDFFKSGNEFLRNWHYSEYDLIILDIFMDEMSGVELARRIRNQNTNVRIVFCSTSNDFACESYSVDASYYIQKPVTSENIRSMIQRLNIEDYELRRFILLPDQQKVLLRNIIYAEYSKHVITIHIKNGPDLKTRLSLSKFTDLLNDYTYFIACNKGTIVNMYEIVEWQPMYFTMSNHDTIVISRRKKNEIEKEYRNFLFASIRKDL